MTEYFRCINHDPAQDFDAAGWATHLAANTTHVAVKIDKT